MPAKKQSLFDTALKKSTQSHLPVAIEYRQINIPFDKIKTAQFLLSHWIALHHNEIVMETQ